MRMVITVLRELFIRLLALARSPDEGDVALSAALPFNLPYQPSRRFQVKSTVMVFGLRGEMNTFILTIPVRLFKPSSFVIVSFDSDVLARMFWRCNRWKNFDTAPVSVAREH